MTNEHNSYWLLATGYWQLGDRIKLLGFSISCQKPKARGQKPLWSQVIITKSRVLLCRLILILYLLSTKPYRLSAIRVASGDLFLRAEFFDVVEVRSATKEQVVDHDLASDVLNLTPAEVVGSGQHFGVGFG